MVFEKPKMEILTFSDNDLVAVSPDPCYNCIEVGSCSLDCLSDYGCNQNTCPYNL